MDKRNISITIWGAEKGNWVEWYNDIKNLMKKFGYENTHIGIVSEHYSTGKIMTVARKEKEIISNIVAGEIPMSFSCYSLPEGYKVASFDYNFLCVRKDSYMSIIIKEADYNIDNEKLIISMMNKYICLEYGEIYSSIDSEMPLLYAETRDKNNLETYKLIKYLDGTLHFPEALH